MPDLPDAVPPAARDRVIDLLTRHYANDQLTEAQLDARFEAVYQAKSVRELDAIIADLPALVQPGEQDGTDIRAALSGQEPKLVGVVPRHVKLRARLGYVELDLTQARFEPGVTTIDVGVFAGYVEIRFPAGVRVETSGRAFLGYFAIKGAVTDAPAVVRIVGRARFGYVEGLLPS